MNILSVVNNPLIHDNRVLNEAESLQRAYHNVTICAYYEKGLEQYQKIGGISVVRIKLLSPGFSIFKIARIIEFVIKTVLINRNKNVDVIHCHDLTTLSVGYLYKKFVRKEIKVIYDAHEYETEYNGLRGVRKVIYKILERHLIKYVDRVITVSDMIGDEYVRLYAIDKPTIILNCPWKRERGGNFDIFRDKFPIRQDQIIFLYQGIVGKGRGIEILLEVFSKMENDKAVIVFMGFGSLETDIIEYSKKYNSIFFQETVRPPEYLDYTASADYGISFIEDVSLSDRYCLPNKLFEYINSGIPVICSNLPEMKKFVEEKGVGVVAEENTASGLKSAITRALNLDREQLKRTVDRVSNDYCWEVQGKRLVELYSGL